MSKVSDIDVTTDSDAQSQGDTASPRGALRSRKWSLWAVAVVVLAATLWYGIDHSGGLNPNVTVADCTEALVSPPNTPPLGATYRPGVVGLGSIASIATIHTPTGWVWCFDGMGIGTGGISRKQMRAAVATPVAVVDGSLTSDVLMLVHLARHTTSVVVTTATSRSIVIARASGFEVLRIPMAHWPPWHAPWIRGPIALGRIMGFDKVGRVTSSQPFTWCPGGINNTPGTGC
jgi:hypothetical protein